MAASKRDPGSVFLNVPFDRAYEPFFVTLVSALISLGQTPRCVLEVRERGQGRLARIYELLRSCGVSIHDLIYHHQLNGIVDCIADLFQLANVPTPAVLKAEARISPALGP